MTLFKTLTRDHVATHSEAPTLREETREVVRMGERDDYENDSVYFAYAEYAQVNQWGE